MRIGGRYSFLWGIVGLMMLDNFKTFVYGARYVNFYPRDRKSHPDQRNENLKKKTTTTKPNNTSMREEVAGKFCTHSPEKEFVVPACCMFISSTCLRTR